MPAMRRSRTAGKSREETGVNAPVICDDPDTTDSVGILLLRAANRARNKSRAFVINFPGLDYKRDTTKISGSCADIWRRDAQCPRDPLKRVRVPAAFTVEQAVDLITIQPDAAAQLGLRNSNPVD